MMEIQVAGMTCDHCVAAVTEELRALAPVTNVSVDLEAGGTSTVRIESTAPINREDLRAAIDEAGYELL
jgi:copper chaperone